MSNHQERKTVGLIGEYAFFRLPPETKETDPIISEIRDAFRSGDFSRYEHSYSRNILPAAGLETMARLNVGDTTYSGEIDYGAIGDGASPTFTDSSTQLVSEQYRKQAGSQARDGKIVYIDWFIAAGDVADGTYTEWGAFIDGTGAANSGQAWSLTAKNIVKSGSLFVAGRYTYSYVS